MNKQCVRCREAGEIERVGLKHMFDAAQTEHLNTLPRIIWPCVYGQIPYLTDVKVCQMLSGGRKIDLI